MPGVVSTRVGYTGGTNKSPTYESVCRGDGHTEAIRLEFDASQLSYEALMVRFFKMAGRGGARSGQYQSAVFAQNASQAKIAQQVAAQNKSTIKVCRPPARFLAHLLFAANLCFRTKGARWLPLVRR